MRGNRLKLAREAHQLSQEELGERCGLSKQQIYRYESEFNDPTADVLARIAKELEVSTDYLVGLVDEPDEHLQEEPLNPVERNLVSAYRRGDLRQAMRILSENTELEMEK